jgi:hypothetical protein
MIATTIVILVVVLVAISGTDAKLAGSTKHDVKRGKDAARAIRSQFLDLANNPMATKVESHMKTAAVASRFEAASTERPYVSFMVFSHSSCSMDSLQTASVMQTNKCTLAGDVDDFSTSNKAEYEWSSVSSTAAGTATLNVYTMRGHCQSSGATVVGALTYTYPTTCFSHGNMYAMVSITDSLPSFPAVPALVIK